jgi:hypothetical protein
MGIFANAQNTNLGTNAGNAGLENTSLGFDAGNVVVSGSGTFVGHQSGKNVTTGASNSFVGAFQGTIPLLQPRMLSLAILQAFLTKLETSMLLSAPGRGISIQGASILLWVPFRATVTPLARRMLLWIMCRVA